MYRLYPGVDEGFRSSETRPKPEKTRDITVLRLRALVTHHSALGEPIISSYLKYIMIFIPFSPENLNRKHT